MLYKFKLTSISLNISFRLSMILILLETLVLLLYNKICIRKSNAFGGFDLNTIQNRFKSRGENKKPSIRGLRCLTQPMKGRERAMSRLASEAGRGIPWSSLEASVVQQPTTMQTFRRERGKSDRKLKTEMPQTFQTKVQPQPATKAYIITLSEVPFFSNISISFNHLSPVKCKTLLLLLFLCRHVEAAPFCRLHPSLYRNSKKV